MRGIEGKVYNSRSKRHILKRFDKEVLGAIAILSAESR